jgi:periplasmic copper chaperone A
MRATFGGFVVGVSLLLVACSGGQTASFAVEDVWARSTPNGLGAVYGTFTTDVDDALVDVRLDPALAGRVELHEVLNDDGVMRMRQVTAVSVLAREPRVLRPGDYHVMLFDLPQMLVEGETFTVTFVFASGRTLTADAQVRLIEDDTMPHGGSMWHSDRADHKDESPMTHGMHRG